MADIRPRHPGENLSASIMEGTGASSAWSPHKLLSAGTIHRSHSFYQGCQRRRTTITHSGRLPGWRFQLRPPGSSRNRWSSQHTEPLRLEHHASLLHQRSLLRQRSGSARSHQRTGGFRLPAAPAERTDGDHLVGTAGRKRIPRRHIGPQNATTSRQEAPPRQPSLAATAVRL